MTTDPRAALARLVAALEGHLDAAANRRGEADPAVETAYQRVADAFEAYDSALYAAYDEVTPLVLYDDVEDEREDGDDEDEDEDEDDDGDLGGAVAAADEDDDEDLVDDLEEDEDDELADDLDDDAPGAPRAVVDVRGDVQHSAP
ncbi:primosomal protein [Kineococcus sp. NUM-3379]